MARWPHMKCENWFVPIERKMCPSSPRQTSPSCSRWSWRAPSGLCAAWSGGSPGRWQDVDGSNGALVVGRVEVAVGGIVGAFVGGKQVSPSTWNCFLGGGGSLGREGQVEERQGI